MACKRRSVANRPVDAVEAALKREEARRGSTMKPIEVVKVALAAYLSFTFREDREGNESTAFPTESRDAAQLRRGTEASIDRLLFNANYWRAAYESRIIAACARPEDAQLCLQAVSVWNAHTLKLNRLSPDETAATFVRFCPPFALNQRRGSHEHCRAGKGPLPDFKKAIEDLGKHGAEPAESLDDLRFLLVTMEAEAAAYESFDPSTPLRTLFDVLPAWCLQNRIELVSGSWWDDCAVMGVIIDGLYRRFLDLGFSEAACQYFLDSCYEALDAYHRDLSSEPIPLSELDIPQLITLVQEARREYPTFETDGYGHQLPAWLISKEQLIWNILVCAIYGPPSTRPLLVDSPDMLSSQGYTEKTDVITELAQTSFTRYTADRIASQADQEFASFAQLPSDLRDSSIAYIVSIHRKLDTLGYEVLPAGTCYPERCVTAFTASEVECLAILEHRRWLQERQKAGWRYGATKDVEAKRSPYLVPWEELPDRAREWNRSAVRSIPSLLASVNLAVVK